MVSSQFEIAVGKSPHFMRMAVCLKKMEFDIDENIRPSLIAVVKTPSGGFAAIKTATTKLNGVRVPGTSWPDRPEVTVPVELKRKNTLEFEVDGPAVWRNESNCPGSLLQIATD